MVFDGIGKRISELVNISGVLLNLSFCLCNLLLFGV